MGRIERALYILTIAVLLGAYSIARAQNPTLTPSYFTISTSVVHNATTCPTPAAGFVAYCDAGDGPFLVSSAGIFTSLIPGVAAAPTLTINGTTKALPGPFTIAAAPPTVSAPSATAPAITAQ